MAWISYQGSYSPFIPNFSSFVSLWTLSLAPLIAHIVAGVPQQVYLAHPRPNLLQQLVHWNPTSILWRYFTICDRRIRAKRWDRATLAATNAAFWTKHGWDGTENMLNESQPFLTRIPRKTHVELLSASFPQTIVVTLQGIQALYQLIEVQSFATSNFGILPAIFLPLALFGLFRLPAAYWLIEDFGYTDISEDTTQHTEPGPRDVARGNGSLQLPVFDFESNPSQNSSTKLDPLDMADSVSLITSEPRSSVVALGNPQHTAYATSEPLDQSFPELAKTMQQPTVIQRDLHLLGSTINSSTQFYPTRGWRGVSVRIFFLLPTFGLLAIAITYISLYGAQKDGLRASGFLMILTYMFFTVITAVFFLANMFRRASLTTVLPGIDSIWYKTYTCILFSMATTMFILASLEQMQPPCDAAGGCQGLSSLTDFSLHFNGSSNRGYWNISGHMNASYVFAMGHYAGLVEGMEDNGRPFNYSIGSP